MNKVKIIITITAKIGCSAGNFWGLAVKGLRDIVSLFTLKNKQNYIRIFVLVQFLQRLRHFHWSLQQKHIHGDILISNTALTIITNFLN